MDYREYRYNQYNQMKGHPQKQFHAERSIIKNALKSLVKRKQEIRIHFLSSTICQVRKLDLNEQPTPDAATLEHPTQLQQPSDGKQAHSPQAAARLDANALHSSRCQEDLFEVIYRHANRMESIGWHEEHPARRTSNMSRTFRRRRRSNLQDYSTNDHLQFDADENQPRGLKSSRLAVNNMELSGFTNQEILKKSAKSIEVSQPHKNPRLNSKYPQILTFIGQKNFKRVEFIPPANEDKGIFSIAADRVHRKWKFQDIPQAKSSGELFNPELNLGLDQSRIDINQPKDQPRFQRSTLTPRHHDHPFLKQLKPSTQLQRKINRQPRTYSQFIRNRPKYIQSYKSQRVENLEEACRPWSVFRNVDDKNDDPKPTLEQHNND